MPYTLEGLTRLIAKHNFCILATQGLHRPNVAGVGYFANGLDLYIATSANTVKVRNVQRDSRVAVHLPVPWPLIPAPPRSIQFRANARILPVDDANANAALNRGSLVMRRALRWLLKNVDRETWGESVCIHVHPRKRIETFLIGVPYATLLHDQSKAWLHFDVSQSSLETEEQNHRRLI